MKFLPVDQYGDMMPFKSKADLLTDTDAVKAAIDSRLGLTIGDWWEDRTLGFEVPRFLVERVTQERIPMLVNYVAAYVLQTQGVTDLASTDYNYYDRELMIMLTVNTEFGETAEGEVGMNELLSATTD